jgi:hypothetical protein
MRKVMTLMVAAASMAVAAAPALAATTCINTRDIKNQTVEGRGTALLFTMKDGTQYRNRLKGVCPDLMFNGFVWVIRNPDQTVCDNMETIRVLRSGEICQIGAFEKVSRAPANRPPAP